MCHAGEAREPRRPDVFLEGVEQFRRKAGRDGRIAVRFVGRVPDSVTAWVHAGRFGETVTLEGPGSYEEALQVMAASDVLVLIEAACEEGIFLPSKFVDYVQTGRPILALSPQVGTVNDILSAYGGGIAVDCRSPEAVADAIASMYDHWRAGTLEATFGSGRLLGLFGADLVLGRYLELFRRIRAEEAGKS